MSVRLSDAVRSRLRDRAEARGETAAGLAQRLIDEGLRMEMHPRMVFRDAPAGGRTAGLAGGPDVVEVVDVVVGLEATGDAAVEEAAAWLSLTPAQVRAALDYYADFDDEIDRERERRAEVAREARTRWERQQQLLS